MKRYSFRFRDDETPHFNDAEFPNDEVARLEALNCARDLLVEQVLERQGERPTGLAVRVFAEDGSEVASVRFEDVPPDDVIRARL
ncbi:MAG: hypothetical protein KF723_15560 [Rhizobiaceae bacterium]|nr:hypothetical protein [Rhizobiaceae bacterium]